MVNRFTLCCDQVPAPCKSALWVDNLRWCICVMDPADQRLGFIASCLAYAVKHDGLTQRQGDACNAILKRLMDDWANGILLCQNVPPSTDDLFTAVTKVEVKH